VSGSRAGLTARPAPSEPYVQVSPHTAQASASAYEVDRGDRPGGTSGGREHGSYPRWRGRGAPRCWCCRLLEIRIEDRLAGRAPARLRHLGESLFTLIHKMTCYTKPLKYQGERVRPQFHSLRQSHQSGHSFCCAPRRPEPRRMPASRLIYSNHEDGLRSPFWSISCLSSAPFSDATEPRPFWYGCWKFGNSMA
jgi:hypothetical protein